MAGRSARPIFRPEPNISLPAWRIANAPQLTKAHAASIAATEISMLRRRFRRPGLYLSSFLATARGLLSPLIVKIYQLQHRIGAQVQFGGSAVIGGNIGL